MVLPLGQLSYSADKVEVQAENLRKMFLAMAKDIRVILISLQTVFIICVPYSICVLKKQQKKARENA